MTSWISKSLNVFFFINAVALNKLSNHIETGTPHSFIIHAYRALLTIQMLLCTAHTQPIGRVARTPFRIHRSIFWSPMLSLNPTEVLFVFHSSEAIKIKHQSMMVD